MTATDELRAMLDERGVEWDEYGDAYTLLRHGGREYTVQPNVCNRLIVTNLTPEQAIAAMLGRGTCKEVYLLMATDIGDGREEVLGVYATEEAAMAAINENQFGYALHYVRKWEVGE